LKEDINKAGERGSAAEQELEKEKYNQGHAEIPAAKAKIKVTLCLQP
jgi:hypothetical protein